MQRIWFVLHLFLIGCVAAGPRCRWQKGYLKDEVGRAQFLLGFHRNRTVTECQDLCEAESDCKSIDRDRHMTCALVACSIFGQCDLGTVTDWLAHGHHLECIEAPTSLIVGVLSLGGMTGATTLATIRCLKVTGTSSAVVVAICVAGVVIVLGLVPMFVSRSPQSCTQVRTDENINYATFFPVNMLAVAGSSAGVAIAGAKVRIASWRHTHALAKLATVYFIFSIFCNLAGCASGVLQGCAGQSAGISSAGISRRAMAKFFLGIWLLSSVGTNLLLQRLLVLRASMLENTQTSAKRLTKIFTFEVVAVFAMIAIGIASIIFVELGVTAQIVWTLLISLQAFCVVGLFMSDLFFSLLVSKIMVRALRICRQSSTSSVGTARGSDVLANAVLVATSNLFAIAISVVTTSLFYSNALILLGLEATQKRSATAVGVFIVTWLVDSLTNDICVVFVGFGPVYSSLEILGAARSADVIGAPVQDTPNDVFDTVIGHVVVPAISGQRDLGNAEENKMHL